MNFEFVVRYWLLVGYFSSSIPYSLFPIPYIDWNLLLSPYDCFLWRKFDFFATEESLALEAHLPTVGYQSS